MKRSRNIEAAKKFGTEHEHKWDLIYMPRWSPAGGLYKKRCKICGYEED